MRSWWDQEVVGPAASVRVTTAASVVRAGLTHSAMVYMAGFAGDGMFTYWATPSKEMAWPSFPGW